MEVIIFALGMIIGGALSGATVYNIMRKPVAMKQEEEKAPDNKPAISKQWENLFEYDGNNQGRDK